jgi:hypothetical protein
VPPGIQRGVRKHGDSDEFDLIQNSPGNISPTAPPPGLPAPVNMKFQLVCLIAPAGDNGIVGTDHIAHGASHTGIRGIRFLPDAVEYFIICRSSFLDIHRRMNASFAKNPQFNGIHRAYRRATAAKGAFVFVPVNLPWQIFQA